ncbi:hypothetical protein [Saccharothrix sp.]|uniref:hypothetical protein n=1 Tax=Saccharothrix sp. TaxID=1873460 RepID=UPI0028126F0C|nr:hypothetical protein [Saccharothrix sp.]
MREQVHEVTVERLLRGVRWAIVVITAVSLLGFALPVLVAGGEAYRSLPRQVAAFALLLVVLVFGTRPRGPARWVLPALVLVASGLALTGMHDRFVVSEEEWSFGVIGWFGVLLLLDLGPRATCAFLALHVAGSFAYTAWVGQDTGDLAVVAVLVLGYQLPVVAAAAVVDRVAADAARAARREAATRTASSVAERLHEDRKARYDALLPTVVPLLTDLTEGRADLTDDRVRARYAVEAARMRRLFAEQDDVPDPLVHELRACVDVAERRGVAVHLDTLGERPTPPVVVRRELVDADRPVGDCAVAGQGDCAGYGVGGDGERGRRRHAAFGPEGRGGGVERGGGGTGVGGGDVAGVVVVDDHPAIVAGIQAWCAAASPPVRVLDVGATPAVAGTGPGADADVVVLDLHLGGQAPAYADLRRLVVRPSRR